MDGSQVFPPPAIASAVDKAGLLALYQELLPCEFFWTALRNAQIRENNRVYTSAVVVWLMMVQRLQPQGTLESAVLELLGGLPGSFWPQPCKRLARAAGKAGQQLSKQTAAYNQARQELSLPVLEQCLDHSLRELLVRVRTASVQGEVFFIDGTTARTAHSQELVGAYPPTANQHGVSHWPILRVLAAHDLYTGLVLRPQWGPVNGPQAVSEQALLEGLIDRLPRAATIVADANFGVFSVANAAAQRSHPVIVRLTNARAQHLARGHLQDATDRRIQWRPTREDRRAHPELPPDACVSGRLIVRKVQPSNGAEPFLLALFTTLEDPAEEVVELYGKRWRMEVDLRSLKVTLRLDELTSLSSEMVAKEITVAMLTYNLVRAVIYQTAQVAGLEPRDFSFTQVRNVLQAFVPRIAAASDEQTKQELLDKMQHYLSQCKLSKRRRPSYPRSVWPKPKTYPTRHNN